MGQEMTEEEKHKNIRDAMILISRQVEFDKHNHQIESTYLAQAFGLLESIINSDTINERCINSMCEYRMKELYLEIKSLRENLLDMSKMYNDQFCKSSYYKNKLGESILKQFNSLDDRKKSEVLLELIGFEHRGDM